MTGPRAGAARACLLAAAAAALALAGCGGGTAPGDPPARAAVEGGLRLPAKVVGDQVRPALGGRFAPRFWGGVNLGSTIPGHQPGEVAAGRADYDRWLPQMAAMGVDVVRVYTILRPDFYDAVRAYNLAHPGREIWVLHGVWIPEERFLATGDLYDAEVVREFRDELTDAVAVVHGDARLPARPGHAGGTYTSDISPWLLGWSIGVEWDPIATASTDRLNRGRAPHRGRYVRSLAGSTPTETWIAAMLDHLAAREAARGWSRPLTFTNWLTADPLRHPEEPLAKEDMVSVDAMHVRATAAWPAGFFASYHAYPYYPDFLRFDREYARYARPRDGVADPYSGYLNALRRHHRGQAVMVTEFGVPSSFGLAHLGPSGRDQGGHSEPEAAAITAEMLRDIHEEGYAGGIVFEWTDEWFKFTWNTIEYEIPGDRRQLWRNPLTNEERFGIVATEAGAAPVAVLDGDDGEWVAGQSQVIQEGRGPVREVRATHDAEFLHLRVRFDAPEAWRDAPVTIGLDARSGGNGGLPDLPGVHPEAERAVTVGPGDRASLSVAGWTDPVLVQYGPGLGFIPFDPRDADPAARRWVTPRLMLNRPYTVPSTGERRAAELAPIGDLPWGPQGDDARNLVAGRAEVLEMRVPWSLLGLADPSSKRALVPRPDGTFTTEPARRIGITVTVAGATAATAGYDWEPWNAVEWRERVKDGYGVLRDAFVALRTPPAAPG